MANKPAPGFPASYDTIPTVDPNAADPVRARPSRAGLLRAGYGTAVGNEHTMTGAEDAGVEDPHPAKGPCSLPRIDLRTKRG